MRTPCNEPLPCCDRQGLPDDELFDGTKQVFYQPTLRLHRPPLAGGRYSLYDKKSIWSRQRLFQIKVGIFPIMQLFMVSLSPTENFNATYNNPTGHPSRDDSCHTYSSMIKVAQFL